RQVLRDPDHEERLHGLVEPKPAGREAARHSVRMELAGDETVRQYAEDGQSLRPRSIPGVVRRLAGFGIVPVRIYEGRRVFEPGPSRDRPMAGNAQRDDG